MVSRTPVAQVMGRIWLIVTLGSAFASGSVISRSSQVNGAIVTPQKSGIRISKRVSPHSKPLMLPKPYSTSIKARREVRDGEKAALPPQLQLPKMTPREVLLGALVVASVLKGAGPAHALDVFDDDWIRNFKVDIAGFEIDHRVIVEGVVLGQFIGFIGALVGGRAAKKRKDEVEKLAKQLKDVNQRLRAKARGLRKSGGRRDNVDPLHERIYGYLRMGKRTLKDKNGEAAYSAFLKAYDAIEEAKKNGGFNNFQAERKAHRGLGAAQMLLGHSELALEHMMKVIDISIKNNDTSGLGDAYGVIADIYTDIDDFERAAMYYDKYIEAINNDMDTSELNLEMSN